ncbi:MAG: DUF3105 domain-containing protein [Ardenticatenaceae bacterium]|nr:DUF3105 domain-containing protein [Ardenticatenaceae bacterium]
MAKRRKVSRSKKTAASSSSNRSLYIWIGVGVVAVGGLIWLLYLSFQPEAVVTIEGLQTFRNLSREHNDAVVYDDPMPPAGGVHAPIWQNCGIYDDPVLAKNAIHSLEHGAVWITYSPDLPADSLAQLKDLVRGQSFILVSPWEGQPEPIVLTAWGLQLAVDDVADERVELFIDEYRLGRQTPEPGATCSGGVGEPTG